MENLTKRYWKLRLERCKDALTTNNFDVFLADDSFHAREIIFKKIVPKINPKTVSWGDSMTLYSTGVLDVFKQDPEIRVIETFDDTLPRPEIIERRREALLADLFFTGSNAVTETGTLVNLDMVGNRVAGIIFGPEHVVITAGRNKIVSDLHDAMERIKGYAAPVNAVRHHIKTPCAKTSDCMDCGSPDRICNTWSIAEKSFPKGRIRVVLINKDLGL
ncbi:lactate utilization protein [Thermodesulfobacteriota bacterium]